jgi:hypothetical protein
MSEIANSERLKSEAEFTPVLRWEDDGGAVSEEDNPIPQVAETNTPRSKDVMGGDLSYDELENKTLKRR